MHPHFRLSVIADFLLFEGGEDDGAFAVFECREEAALVCVQHAIVLIAVIFWGDSTRVKLVLPEYECGGIIE